ncbi:hypothetical protein [Tsukamurella tyrosinosolvens]|uniref:hypothetical protein n=1 Tax=Tsukamurella tyrosinosolvens TaxID=57704 RepID=UPI002DD4269E|nr:hypothetical protein [Tsukamurella tyrosinosolvens]MEC4611812.1 hypothetical protein [Tsukamurella tyrosinosolvens]
MTAPTTPALDLAGATITLSIDEFCALVSEAPELMQAAMNAWVLDRVRTAEQADDEEHVERQKQNADWFLDDHRELCNQVLRDAKCPDCGSQGWESVAGRRITLVVKFGGETSLKFSCTECSCDFEAVMEQLVEDAQ